MKPFLLSFKSPIIIALPLLFASLLVKWFDMPLGHSIRSYHLYIFSNRFSLNPQVFSISFGTAIIGLLFLGSFAVFKDKSWIKLLTGLSAIFLGLLIICKIVFFNLALAEDILDQNMQVIQMMSLTRQLPPNRGFDPTFRLNLSTYTIMERVDLTWHFLTRGWYFLMMSAGIFVISGLKNYPFKRIVTLSIISSLCLSLMLLIVTARPILAEYHKYKGDAFLSKQQYQKALHSYTIAIKHNSELISNAPFALNYGEIHYNLALTDSPYYLFYLGDQLYELGRTSEAINLLTKTYKLSPNDSVLRVALSKAFSIQGNDYFRKGILGSAIGAWEKSLQIDPEQIQNWYYLSLAYKDAGLYKKAIFAGQQFSLLSNNETLLANTYANMGDSYYWMRDYLLARAYYEKSRSIDPFTNYRVGRALGGT